MIDWPKIAIEVGILGFFALLYYLYQRRKLKRYHHDETVEQYALWIYDYHHFLDTIKDNPEYKVLNAFVAEIEKIDLKNNGQRVELIANIPVQMPEDFRDRLQFILEV